MGIVGSIIVFITGLIFLIFSNLVMKILRPKTALYSIKRPEGYKEGFHGPYPPANEIYGEKAMVVFRGIGIIFIIVSIFLFFN